MIDHGNIVRFLQEAYSDAQLCALKAHVEDGKLSYCSCCCFVGAATATHALKGDMEVTQDGTFDSHLWEGRKLDFAINGKSESRFTGHAEREFIQLGLKDADRRRTLLPMIDDEIQRREWVKLLLRKWAAPTVIVKTMEKEGITVL